MKLQLTDWFCQHAKSSEPQTDYFDETVTGLALRVTSHGTKAWTFLYGTPRRRITLGRYPSVSLATARALAIEAREGRTQVMTIAALTERYLQALKGKRSFRQIERLLRRDVLAIIGSIPLSELHRRDVTRVIDAKAAPIAARRAFDQLRAMIRWAVARGDLDHNPIDGMKGPAASKPRERVLTDDEIRVLWLSLPQLRSPACQRVIKFCLVTGQRIGEVTGLRRSELDLARKVWNIPGSRTKNGHPHSVPLSPMALEIIGESFDVVRRMYVSDTIRENQFGLPRWTTHDLRRTALTKMAELGVAPIVLGHVANHRTTTKAGITLGVYVQHAYEKEKREALELWANRLQGIISGAGEVVAIGSGR
ncbi:MAG TPA: tyrosine-type recombinase/integrase [Bradyrhizobium sp.]|nr:tyrosine-type recombinase/integrase [Bradyrhizobium sp.]